jgi:hypothetical protein
VQRVAFWCSGVFRRFAFFAGQGGGSSSVVDSMVRFTIDLETGIIPATELLDKTISLECCFRGRQERADKSIKGVFYA